MVKEPPNQLKFPLICWMLTNSLDPIVNIADAWAVDLGVGSTTVNWGLDPLKDR